MGIFDKFRKDSIVDLSEKYRQDSGENSEVDVGSIEERRRRLAKRISDMTDKIDELSNLLNRLNERVEVLEKKMKLNLSN